MPLTKIGPKHQVTIPREVFNKLRLEVGDYLDVEATEEGILMVPKKLVPKDEAWFHTKKWQEKEGEADAAIAQGQLSEPFATVDALMEHLEKAGKRRRGKKTV
jgi:AbrB family looped-hinge helix DNA binding protein